MQAAMGGHGVDATPSGQSQENVGANNKRRKQAQEAQEAQPTAILRVPLQRLPARMNTELAAQLIVMASTYNAMTGQQAAAAGAASELPAPDVDAELSDSGPETSIAGSDLDLAMQPEQPDVLSALRLQLGIEIPSAAQDQAANAADGAAEPAADAASLQPVDMAPVQAAQHQAQAVNAGAAPASAPATQPGQHPPRKNLPKDLAESPTSYADAHETTPHPKEWPCDGTAVFVQGMVFGTPAVAELKWGERKTKTKVSIAVMTTPSGYRVARADENADAWLKGELKAVVDFAIQFLPAHDQTQAKMTASKSPTSCVSITRAGGKTADCRLKSAWDRWTRELNSGLWALPRPPMAE